MRSLELAGAPKMDRELEERVFQRIYSIFGSQSAYERFEDALPFLHWAGRHGVACGLLSNADERYGTSNHGGDRSHIDYSKPTLFLIVIIFL